jgi:hypothetical protein
VRYRVKGMLEKAVGGVSWAVRQKRKVQMHMLLRSQSQQDNGRAGVTAAAAAGGGGGGMQGSGFTPVSGLAAAAGPGESTGRSVGLEGGSSSSDSSYNNSFSSFCLWEEEFHGCGHVGGLWAMYLQWAGLRGAGMEAARKVFFRGLHACPGDKGLWLEGLGGAVGDLGSGEAQGLMVALEEREVMKRVEMVEAMLEEIQEQEEQQQQQ